MCVSPYFQCPPWAAPNQELVVISHFTPQKELKGPNARNRNVQDGPAIVNGNLSGQTWKS